MRRIRTRVAPEVVARLGYGGQEAVNTALTLGKLLPFRLRVVQSLRVLGWLLVALDLVGGLAWLVEQIRFGRAGVGRVFVLFFGLLASTVNLHSLVESPTLPIIIMR
mmetsp:Transcript_10747/g.16365  ORF Transcript_10747/g.16365 Transcript_10747/m.16365 type:complete len:107 (+) Transcript_10747:670-990(+)